MNIIGDATSDSLVLHHVTPWFAQLHVLFIQPTAFALTDPPIQPCPRSPHPRAHSPIGPIAQLRLRSSRKPGDWSQRPLAAKRRPALTSSSPTASTASAAPYQELKKNLLRRGISRACRSQRTERKKNRDERGVQNVVSIHACRSHNARLWSGGAALCLLFFFSTW